IHACTIHEIVGQSRIGCKMMVILCEPDRLPVHVCPVTFFPHLMLMPCYIRHRFFLKSSLPARIHRGAGLWLLVGWILLAISGKVAFAQETNIERSEERRVGKECRSEWMALT